MKACQLISKASYGPDALKVLFQAFDEAWQGIAGNFGGKTLAIQAVRLRLANITLEVSRDGSNDPKQLKNAALEIMASDLRTGAR